MAYSFEKILGTLEQSETLYQMLLERDHNISHSVVPGFETHYEFVKNHPYRDWFLVKEDKKCIGTLYLKYDNSIGLNLREINCNLVKMCIEFVELNFQPATSQPSMIPDYFYINVAVTNEKLIDVAGSIKLSPLQLSFKI